MRRKMRTWNDLVNEILQASAALDREQGAWRVNIADCPEKERVDRGKAQESQEEKEMEEQEDIVTLFWQQT
ncbi:unnamed protein product [Caretta caretta]